MEDSDAAARAMAAQRKVEVAPILHDMAKWRKDGSDWRQIKEKLSGSLHDENNVNRVVRYMEGRQYPGESERLDALTSGDFDKFIEEVAWNS